MYRVPSDRVIISSRRFGTQLLIDITDNGPGMDDAFIRDELFLPFRSTKSGGYGIGAFQTRELIRMAGGDLEVISEKGFGTTMRIILPLVSEREPATFLRRDLRRTCRPTPKPLLIVDDDTGLLRQLRWAFSDHKVFPAGTRQEAIDLVRREAIPVAILDLGLPPDPDGASEGLATLTEILAIAPGDKSHHRDRQRNSRARVAGDRARRLRLLSKADRYRCAAADRQPRRTNVRARRREPPAG